MNNIYSHHLFSFFQLLFHFFDYVNYATTSSTVTDDVTVGHVQNI